MEAAEVFVDDILAHVGVKGMKWGVRKRPSAVTISQKGKKIKISGGHRRPAHSDAIRARTSEQILKKSGSKALSDQELQQFTKRLQLEQNVHRLTQNPNSAKKFVAGVLSQTGKSVANEVGNQVVSHQVKKHLTPAMIKKGLIAPPEKKKDNN